MMKSVAFLSLSLAALVGCGGGESKKPPVVVVDAPPNNTVDAPDQQGGCTAPATLGLVAQSGLSYEADSNMMNPGTPEAWTYFAAVDATQVSDLLVVGLYEGPPPNYTTEDFPAAPFTIQLTGGEVVALECSTCVQMLTDVDLNTLGTENLVYADDYFATGGSVVVNTLTATNIEGMLQNVTLGHVDFAMDGTQTPNASGCSSTVNMPFSGMVQMNKTTGRLEAVIKVPGLKRNLVRK